MKSKQRKQDIYIHGDAVISSEAGYAKSVSRGIEVSLGGWLTASNQTLLDYQNEMKTLLRSLKSTQQLQVIWQQGSDCQELIQNYFEETENLPATEWSREQRSFNCLRFEELRKLGQIRHSTTQIYLIEQLAADSNNEQLLIEQKSGELESHLKEWGKAFERLGGQASILRRDDLINAQEKHYQCDVSDSRAYDLNKPAIDHFLKVPLEPVEMEDICLKNHKYYHAYLILSDLPQLTITGMMHGLTSLNIHGYSMQLRAKPLNALSLIEQEDTAIKKLNRARMSSKRVSLDSTIEMKQEKVRRLSVGDLQPLEMQWVVNLWDEDPIALQAKVREIQVLIARSLGARSETVNLPTTGCNLFLGGIPGSEFREASYLHYIEDTNLSHLLPIGGEPKPKSTRYESLYPGCNGSLKGINTFWGEKGNRYPAHAVVMGRTGSGKSCGLMELLTQTGPYFEKTIVVDQGFSYASYAETYENANILVIEHSGEHVLNYLSTQGRAVNQEQIASAAKVLEHMIGDGMKNNPHWSPLIIDLLSAFYQQWLDAPEVDWKFAYQNIEESKQPTHSDLCNWLESLLEDPRHAYGGDIRLILVFLQVWRRDRGVYTLFDGEGNVDLGGDMVCLELSKLDTSQPQLLRITTEVILNRIRKEIINAPRGIRKRVVFEELGAFLNVPGGKELVRDFYERSRKYNCWVVSVIQQLSLLPEDLATSILGNSRQAFIFGQAFEADVRIMQKHFKLSEAAVQNIMRFMEPSVEHGAPFLHWYTEDQQNHSDILWNVPSPEMLYLSSSSGEHFDKRQKQLAAPSV